MSGIVLSTLSIVTHLKLKELHTVNVIRVSTCTGLMRVSPKCMSMLKFRM